MAPMLPKGLCSRRNGELLEGAVFYPEMYYRMFVNFLSDAAVGALVSPTCTSRISMSRNALLKQGITTRMPSGSIYTTRTSGSNTYNHGMIARSICTRTQETKVRGSTSEDAGATRSTSSRSSPSICSSRGTSHGPQDYGRSVLASDSVLYSGSKPRSGEALISKIGLDCATHIRPRIFGESVAARSSLLSSSAFTAPSSFFMWPWGFRSTTASYHTAPLCFTRDSCAVSSKRHLLSSKDVSTTAQEMVNVCLTTGLKPPGACMAPNKGFLTAVCGLDATQKECDRYNSTRHYSGSTSYWGQKFKGKEYTDEAIKEWKTTFPHLKEYDNVSLRAWRRVFDDMDRDADGYLSQADLQKTPEFTLAKAYKLRGMEAMKIEYDADKNNLIDFGEFVKAMYNVDLEMFLEFFQDFDPVDIQLEFDKYAVVDEACPTKKYIPESQVETIMQHNKFTCITAPDIKRLFKELDMNGDGVIDFTDFQKVSMHFLDSESHAL